MKIQIENGMDAVSAARLLIRSNNEQEDRLNKLEIEIIRLKSAGVKEKGLKDAEKVDTSLYNNTDNLTPEASAVPVPVVKTKGRKPNGKKV